MKSNIKSTWSHSTHSRCRVCFEFTPNKTLMIPTLGRELTGVVCSEQCVAKFEDKHVWRCATCSVADFSRWHEIPGRSEKFCAECAKSRQCECGEKYTVTSAGIVGKGCPSCALKKERKKLALEFLNSIPHKAYRVNCEARLPFPTGLQALRSWAEYSTESCCFVSGKTGCGKTRSAVILAAELIEKGEIDSARYVSGPDLTTLSPSGWSDLIEDLVEIDFLILDEIDKVPRKGVELVSLYSLIDRRLGAREVMEAMTVVISNTPPQEWVKGMEKKTQLSIADPLARRLGESALPVPFFQSETKRAEVYSKLRSGAGKDNPTQPKGNS